MGLILSSVALPTCIHVSVMIIKKYEFCIVFWPLNSMIGDAVIDVAEGGPV